MGSSICTEQLRLCGPNPNDPEQVHKVTEMMAVKKYLKSIETMKQLYKLTDTVLGTGSFGKVILAESTSDPNIKFSIKMVSKELLGANCENFKEVYSLLKTVEHPAILKYYDYYENDTYFYLVMELFEGQQLLDIIISHANNNKGCMPEETARKMIK